MLRGEDLPDRMQGVALFADISGFTPLTEALVAALGLRRGADELTRQLNLVYEALIAQVHRYGGSVVSFSGDGITCWFQAGRPPGSEAAGLRATACAQAMQQAIKRFAKVDIPSSQAISLAIKVGLASGPVRRFRVGDPHIQYLDVLAGVTLDRMAAAQAQAGQGEIVLGAELADQLGRQVELVGWRADTATRWRFAVGGRLAVTVAEAPWPAPPASGEATPSGGLGEDQTRPWVLAPVYERLNVGQGRFLADLRTAVALFLRFGGLDYDGDDAAGEKLDAYLRWIQNVLARYEGYLIQLTTGDKGSYLYAVFGAPLAHEDDAVRAVAAALELRTPPPELRFIRSVQIGLSQGQMRAGAYGSPERRTYGVLGSEVNIAARLMSKARPGQILASKRVADAAARSYRFEDLGAVELKGRQAAIPVFSALGDHPSRPHDHQPGDHQGRPYLTTQAAMIGRAAERAALGARLRALQSDRVGGVVAVEGEAGIGKSRLVADFVDQARALGVTCLAGAGDAIGTSTPYHAWRPVFRQLLDPDGGDVPPPGAGFLARWSSIPELARLAPLLTAVLPLDMADNEITAQMTGQVRADNTHELLVRLLQAAAGQTPTALILEDSHWLDSASWALAGLVSQRVQPLLMLITARPVAGPPPAGYAELLQNPATRRLVLEPLPAEDTVALVSQRLGVARLPEPVAALIRTKAEGNPFFGEELGYALREAGLIQIVDGECRIASESGKLSALDVPDTVEGAITSRVDRLAPAHQLTLKVASVIGRDFAFSTLRDIHPVAGDILQLSGHLEATQRLDLVVPDRPEPDLAYLFKHAITHDVVYNLLLFDQRQELHRNVAEWYERAHAEELAPFYPLLAHHWRRAEDAPKSVEYLEKAGDQALRRGAYREAIDLLTHMLDANRRAGVVSDRARLAVWEHWLGSAYLSVGDFEASFGHLKAALELLGRPLPSGQAGFTLGLVGQILRQVLHRRFPRRFLGRSPQPENALEAASIYENLAQIYYHHNQTLAILYSALQQLNRAEEAPPSPQLARAYASMSTTAGIATLHALAEEYGRLAQQVLPGVTQLTDQGLVDEYVGMYRASLGGWAEAQALFEDAIAKFERIGNRRRWRENMSLLGIMLLPCGQVARAAEVRAQVHTAAVQHGDAQIESWGLLELAEIALLQGKLDAAFDLLNQAAGPGGTLGRTEEIWLYGLLGAAHHRRGQSEPARQAAARAQALISAAPPNAFYLLEAYAGVAEVSLALWESRASGNGAPQKAAGQAPQKAAGQAVKALKQFARAFPFAGPRALLWQGAYAWQAGRPGQARAAWAKGLGAAEKLAMPYEQGLLHDAIGRHLPPDDPARAEHLRRAAEFFAALGAGWDLARASAQRRA
jgi:class 3 adenylate cyclase